MTKSTITRERLAKIKSWRETYGAGSNVMLPAEEAEELASIALAAMDSEPVAWTDEEELRDVNVAGIGYLFGIDREANKFADPRRQIMLYRHAQPAPVVHGEVASAIEELKRTLVDCNRYNYCSDAIARVESACRAAMLAAAPQEVKGE
ncbi:dTDP-6-deoxy-D-glucose-3,5-epimerase [Klebsiella pneumoniae]